MVTVLKTIVPAAMLLVIVSGCGMKGKWQLREVYPEDARSHFNLTEIEFRDDDTFVAKSEQGGRLIETKGRYDFNSWNNDLMLRMGAKELIYSARIWWLKELTLKRELDTGRTLRATFVPAEDKPEAGSLCPTCGQTVE